ncbi:MAG TPA: phytanoyl-CoA dioxygenase family protein [Acidimicrobiales bacterium]|nr:phytanoyl-CoA dioxygenase family protein [Acidimicrobiales bacterium]
MAVPTEIGDDERQHLDERGFVVLRQAFDPRPLSEEIDRSLAVGWSDGAPLHRGGGDVRFRYLPMTSTRTPVSLGLLEGFLAAAEALLGRPVLPGRAKGTEYLGGADWHRDSDLGVPSVGFLAYLEPLRAGQGALRVLTGSNRHREPAAVAAALADADARGEEAGEAVETDPGDVVVLDEHVVHGSSGGERRRQWRVDYVVEPRGEAEEVEVRAWYAGLFPPGWEPGYDLVRFPSFGPDWLGSGRPWVAPMARLGAYEAAAREEAFVRSRRP